MAYVVGLIFYASNIPECFRPGGICEPTLFCPGLISTQNLILTYIQSTPSLIAINYGTWLLLLPSGYSVGILL